MGDSFEIEGTQEFINLGNAGVVAEGVLLREEGGGSKERREGLRGLAAGEAVGPG